MTATQNIGGCAQNEISDEFNNQRENKCAKNTARFYGIAKFHSGEGQFKWSALLCVLPTGTGKTLVCLAQQLTGRKQRLRLLANLVQCNTSNPARLQFFRERSPRRVAPESLRFAICEPPKKVSVAVKESNVERPEKAFESTCMVSDVIPRHCKLEKKSQNPLGSLYGSRCPNSRPISWAKCTQKAVPKQTP